MSVEYDVSCNELQHRGKYPLAMFHNGNHWQRDRAVEVVNHTPFTGKAAAMFGYTKFK